jgi:hypothetical protein
MTVPSRHSGMFLARITFFLPHVMPGLREKRDRRQEPVSPHFRGLSSLPVMPDPDPASPLPRKSKRARSRIGALRDDSPLTSFWHAPSQDPGLREKRGQTSGESSVPIFAVFPPSRHAGLDPASPVLLVSGANSPFAHHGSCFCLPVMLYRNLFSRSYVHNT